MLEWLLLLSFTFGCSVGATVVWFFVWSRAAVLRTLRCDDVFVCPSRTKCFHLSTSVVIFLTSLDGFGCAWLVSKTTSPIVKRGL